MKDKHAFSRRQFVKVLGVSAASVGVFGLAGCATGGSEGSGSGGTAASIVYGSSNEPQSLDPAFANDLYSGSIIGQVYEGLYRYGDKDVTVQPCLAKEMPEISADGTIYTIPLNEGVKFHDGTDFNAEAVKKSIERQLEPNRTSDMPYAEFVYGSEASNTGVKTVEAVDDHTVKITLRSPSTPFIRNLAMVLGAPIVSPTAVEKASGGNISEGPCGTGPYKFVDWTKAASITLAANDAYWGDAPQIKNVVYKFITDPNTRIASLVNGECDIAEGVGISNADQVTSAGLNIVKGDVLSTSYFGYNTVEGICADPEVRKAITQAVNVPELVQKAYGEYADVANSLMPPVMAPYDSDIKQPGFDPDAAKATLAAKGVTSLDCIVPTGGSSVDVVQIARFIQGYLSDVGVTLNINQFDWTTYRTKVQTGPFDICSYAWIGDNGDPDNFMNLLATPDKSINVSRFADSRYTELISTGVVTPDGDARNAIYHECEQIIADKQPILLLSHPTQPLGVNPKVQNFIYHPTGLVYMKNLSKQA